MLKRNFLLCGSLGWCLEVFWTGMHSLLSGEATMMGKSSLLMFPIYGCAALIKPIYKKIAAFPVLLRGSLYTGGIFLTEFTACKLRGKCVKDVKSLIGKVSLENAMKFQNTP